MLRLHRVQQIAGGSLAVMIVAERRLAKVGGREVTVSTTDCVAGSSIGCDHLVVTKKQTKHG